MLAPANIFYFTFIGTYFAFLETRDYLDQSMKNTLLFVAGYFFTILFINKKFQSFIYSFKKNYKPLL